MFYPLEITSMRGQHDGFQHCHRIGYKVVGLDELVGQHNCVR